ncbi:MAG TPA: hypothetical protein VGG81_02545 [Edaphobacter sp.]|jgi:hypothetical protein
MDLLNFPAVIFVVSFLLLWLASWAGGQLGQRQYILKEEMLPDFSVVLGATLTLLGLIIGFSYSMATARYDLRKTYEEAEANAIGTEYVRADLLGPAEAQQVRELLRQYTDLRIRFYVTRDNEELTRINQQTEQIQSRLWTAASQSAIAQPTALRSLAVAGMNDVLNSQGYTQAAWWNRIPTGAWCLMFGIAVLANMLVGYGARKVRVKLFMMLPLVVAVSFFLVADIDSPRRGVIRVHPQNLESLRAGLGE